jgi:hypothetical protein
MNPVTGLALARIAIGSVAIASPELAGKLFRLDVMANPQLSYMSRMFGSREVALGAITLASTGAARRKLIAIGIAVDSADAFAGLESMRTGSVNRSVGIGLTVPALGAVVAGAIGLASKE